jgi:hypothetical protein
MSNAQNIYQNVLMTLEQKLTKQIYNLGPLLVNSYRALEYAISLSFYRHDELFVLLTIPKKVLIKCKSKKI